MALAVADMLAAFSRRTVIDITEGASLTPLFNRDHESELVDANKTTIQNVTDGVAFASRTRAGNWQDATEVAADQLTLSIDQYADESILIPWEDQTEAPIDYIERTRSRLAAAAIDYVDANLGSFITGLTYASAQQMSIGSGNTNALIITGSFKGTGDELIRQGALKMMTKWKRSNFMDGTAVGGMIGDRYWTMTPEEFEILITDLLATNVQLDVLTDDMLRDGAVFGSDAFMGSLFKWPMVVSNRFSLPGNNEDFKDYFGSRAALTFAMPSNRTLTQYFTPEQNQVTAKPGHLLRQTIGFGRLRKQADMLYEVTLNTVNS